MRLLTDLVDLVLPQDRAGCGAPAAVLCPACRALLQAQVPHATTPAPCPPGLPPICTAGTYAGVLRAALLGHKERGRLALTQPLGELLGRAVRALAAGPVVLVPVPSAPSAVRARGHDHAGRLAAVAAGACGLRAAPLLVPGRALGDQSGLSSGERAANLAGALRTRRPVPGLPVVIVDDVVTTGATLGEAARALRSAGALVRGAAVVAATRRRGTGGGGAVPRRDRGLPSNSAP